MAAAEAEAEAEATVTQQMQGMRLGDLDEDNGGDRDFLLQRRFVRGPDENGVRKVIEYGFDDEGNKVEVITIISPVCKPARAPTSKRPIERHSMPNSADAMKGDAGSRITNVSTKGILRERPHPSGNKAEEPTAFGVPLVRSSVGDNVLKECMICCNKGHHWTAKCPFRSLPVVDKPPTADGPAPPGEGTKRAYPPSIMMGAADRIRDHVKKIMNDNRCVRVSNLSEETHETDLVELFCKFGIVTCVYLPVDENGLGSGVGYVKFAQRREAEAAIKRLNGWIYDNLTLQVGWAAPMV